MTKENENKRARVMDDIGVETGGKKDTIGFKFKHTPKPEDTGVPENITRLAAALSGQIYAVEKAEEFDLSTDDLKVDVMFLDNHGLLKCLKPYFACVVTGQTMIIGWRGTTDDIMNVITDLNATPSTCSRWAHISTDLKVHGGFHPIVENDLCSWEAKLVAMMEKHGVTELITTGHSLGGGLATVAHLAIEGDLAKGDTNVWNQYAKKLESQGKEFKVKSVAFSPPSSIFNLADANDNVVNKFLNKIESNSCCIIYSMDPVPRLPGYLSFIDKLALEFIPEAIAAARNRVGGIATTFAKRFVKPFEIYTNLKDGQSGLIEAMVLCRHYGKIIYYEDTAKEPIILKDYGAEELGSPDGIKNFRDIKWQETPDVYSSVMHDHKITVNGPGLGYNIQEDRVSAKLYHLHNRSLMENEPDVAVIDVDGWEDCRMKAKENFVEAFMGGYVDWEDEPKDKDPWERKGKLHVKKDVAKASEDADWVKSRGFFGRDKVKHTALWRTPALADKVTLALED